MSSLLQRIANTQIAKFPGDFQAVLGIRIDPSQPIGAFETKLEAALRR